jgi:hypothetical protein
MKTTFSIRIGRSPRRTKTINVPAACQDGYEAKLDLVAKAFGFRVGRAGLGRVVWVQEKATGNWAKRLKRSGYGVWVDVSPDTVRFVK